LCPYPFAFFVGSKPKGIKSVRLNWATTADKEAHHFVIERSWDGKTFEKVRVVMPTNTPSAKHTYRGVDTQP
jgi:hypothetical protein